MKGKYRIRMWVVDGPDIEIDIRASNADAKTFAERFGILLLGKEVNLSVINIV